MTTQEHCNPLWSASWIWYPKSRDIVNFHFFARRIFNLDEPITSALLRITAYTDYRLYVNGNYIGRGPAPSDPRFQSFDTYDVTNYLRPGKNAIGIICHNYGIGVHWQYKGPGGLFAQLDMETGDGRRTVATDESWLVKTADCWSLDSPRMTFSNGFMETFDCRKYPEGWLDADFDDSGWIPAEVLGCHPLKPWTGLEPRDIPPLAEIPLDLVPMEKGKFTVKGVHAVKFTGIIAPGENKLGYAQTYVYSEDEREVSVIVACDDAFKAFVNNKLAVEQNYSEEFSRTRIWRASDEYEQVHYGVNEHYGDLKSSVKLKKGWNKVLVVVDQGPQGWGFMLLFADSSSERVLDLEFGSDKKGNRRWLLAGPCESNGLSDSLDSVVRDIQKVEAANKLLYNPIDYSPVTDYATLMRFEERIDIKRVSAGDKLVLREGEFCVLELDKVWVTYPEFKIISDGEGVLDIGYSQILSDDHRIQFSNANTMKYVDRVYLREGTQAWGTLQRRTGQYVHISCRKGQKIVLDGISFKAVGYPVQQIAEFESSDQLVNKVWDVSRHTTRLLMQYGYQDCLKREEGSINPNSFNYTSRAAGLCFGDYALARRTMRIALQTQDETGWFHGHGVSSPSSDEPTECLWWAVWLKDYYVQSGDIQFVMEVWENLEDNLRYFAKSINRYGLIDGRNFHLFRQGQYVYMDDSTNNGRYVGYFGGELLGYNILYYAALKAAVFLAEALGLPERSSFYNRKAERVKRSSNDRFWDKQAGRYAEWRKGNRLADKGHAAFQIAALYFGMTDDWQAEILLKYIRGDVGLPDEENTSYPLHTFGFFYYLLDLWFLNGCDEVAVEFLRCFYGKWIELGGTAFGEGFWLPYTKGAKSLPWEYEVHGYGASAHLHFYTNLLGIRPVEPGFKTVLLAPKPGGLQWVRGRVVTPMGPVSVSWIIEDGEFSMEAEVPEDCMCHIEPPGGCICRTIRVNGKDQ